MTRLSDDTILYRAILKKTWINPDTKEIDLLAFMRRFKQSKNAFEEKLSTALKPEDTYNRLNKCFGVICFKVKDLQDLGLDAIQDKPDHVSIINVPHPENEEKKAMDIARKLAKKSKLYIDWLDCPFRRGK